MKKLDVVGVPDGIVTGTYTVNGHPNKMPPRARRLRPNAATSYAAIHDKIIVSDMFRTPESSLAAVESGRGALMPSYSSHGYGLAIDVDVTPSMKLVGAKTKTDFDTWMRGQGWICHRRDGLREHEEWHYDFDEAKLLSSALTSADRTCQRAREVMLDTLYGDAWVLTKVDTQTALRALGFYHGEIDGVLGPISKAAVSAFQRAWHLTADGIPGPKTQRVLWFVWACYQLPTVVV